MPRRADEAYWRRDTVRRPDEGRRLRSRPKAGGILKRAPRAASLAVVALGALSLPALLGSCRPAAPGGGPNVIKIVSSLPRTGSAAAQTTTLVNGIQMAIEEAGRKVGPFTIEYEDWDDASPQRGQWDPDVETANAKKAIADRDVMVYIGTYNSGAAKFSMPELNKAGLVMISPANTAVGLTKPGKGEPNEPMVYRPTGKVNFFRVVPADDLQGSAAAEWAKEMGITKAFVLHDRELYGKGIADVFRARCPALGIEVSGYEGIDWKAANYRSLVTKIKETGAQLVYFGGTTQTNAGQVAKDLVAGGVDAKMMAPDGCFENAFIEASGAENLEGRAFLTFGGIPPEHLTGKGKEFYERYKAKYRSEPESYATYGYEAAKVALDAIRRAGKKDRAAILAAVAATRDFDGALGAWSFDENGDTSLTTMSGNTVRAGRFAFVKKLGN